MNSTDKSGFAAHILAIAEIYGKALSTPAIGIYWTALQGYPLAEVQRAIEHHVHDPDAGRYFPKPADLIRHLQRRSEDDGHPDPDEAWGLLLRLANVTGLRWEQVDLARAVAWIHPDQAKGKRAIPVPLNDEAQAVVRSQIGQHPIMVFTYEGRPVGRPNTKAWKKALRRAGISDFRWHDLRHTWRAGTCKPGRRCTSCRSWADGKLKQW